jgi:hypothetical protein
MKPTKLKVVLAVGLIILGCGCASLRPPSNETIVSESEQRQEQLSKNGTNGTSLGWYLLYYAMYGFGVYLGQAQGIFPN